MLKRKHRDTCDIKSMRKKILSVANPPQEVKSDLKSDPEYIPRAEVDSVRFGLLSSDEIRKQATVNVTAHVTQRGGVVQKNGLHDPNFGPVTNNTVCGTCWSTQEVCQGHLGYVDFGQPVPNEEFIDYAVKVLQSICIHCNNLRLPDDHPRRKLILDPDRPLKDRLKLLDSVCQKRQYCESEAVNKYRKKMATRKRKAGSEAEVKKESEVKDNPMRYCGGRQVRFVKTDKIFIEAVMTLTDDEAKHMLATGEAPIVLGPQDIYEMLSFVPRDHLRLMGFKDHIRPESMLWQAFLVPRINIRPASNGNFKGKGSGQDDLTSRLADIVKAEHKLRASITKEVQDLKNPEKIRSRTCDLVNIVHYVYRGRKSRHPACWLQSDWVESPKSPYMLYQNLVRHVAVYQNLKKKGKGQSYGRDKASIRCRYNKGKKGRVRGTCLGKRMNYAARSVITPDPYMHINDVGVPQWMCMKLTFPETVTAANIQKLTQYIRNGRSIYPGANYIMKDREALQSQVDLDFVDRNSIELELGMVVRRHLIQGDYVLMNRNPTLHRMSILGHRVRVVQGNSFRLHLAVTPGYNADFDGDEMNLMALQDYAARAEARDIMMADKNMLKDGKPIVKFVQHSVISLFLLARDKHLPWPFVCQLWMHWSRDTTSGFPTHKPYYTGRELLSLCLPSGLFVQKNGLLIENGHFIHGDLNSASMNGAGGLLHILVKDFGGEFAGDFVSRMYVMTDCYIRRKGFSVSQRDCEVEWPQDICQQVENTLSQAEELASRKQVLPEDEETVCELVDRARDIAGHHAVKQFENRMNLGERCGLMEMVESGAKGNRVNIVQIAAMVGQQRNHRSERFNEPTAHQAASISRRGLVRPGFSQGLDPLGFFYHLGGAIVGLVDTAVKTGDTGYMHRRIGKSIEDVVVKHDGVVTNAQGMVLQTLYGHDGFDSTWVEQIPLRIFQHGLEWYGPYVAPEMTEAVSYCQEYADAKLSFDADHWVVVSCPVNFARLAQIVLANTPPEEAKEMPLSPEALLALSRKHWHQMLAVKEILGPSWKVQMLYFDWTSVKQLQTWGLVRSSALARFFQHISREFARGRIANGEAVGLIASQSCGEVLTQMTLKTFHFSGSKSTLVNGVPRVDEIINASKSPKTPCMFLFFRQAHSKVDLESVGMSLVGLNVRRLVTKYHFYMSDEIPNYIQSRTNTPPDKPIVVMPLDKQECYRQKITAYQVASRLQTNFRNLRFTCASFICERWWIAFWIEGEDTYERLVTTYMKQLPGKVRPGEIRPEPVEFFEELIYDTLVESVMNYKLRGYSAITDFAVTEREEGRIQSGKLVRQQVAYLMTDGTELDALLADPKVDIRYTYSTNIREVADVLGIDAACAVIEHELATVYNQSGASVLRRHLKIIAERMTCTGKVLPTTYSGVSHGEGSVIRIASFESPMESFVNGALHGQTDHCEGITECLITGKRPNLGTGTFELLNQQTFKHATPKADPMNEPYLAKDTKEVLARYLQSKGAIVEQPSANLPTPSKICSVQPASKDPTVCFSAPGKLYAPFTPQHETENHQVCFRAPQQPFRLWSPKKQCS